MLIAYTSFNVTVLIMNEYTLVSEAIRLEDYFSDPLYIHP